MKNITYNLINREFANIVIEAWKENKIEDLVEQSGFENFSDLIEDMFNESQEIVEQDGKKYLQEKRLASKYYRENGTYKSVKSGLSYVKMLCSTCDTVEEFLIYYCVGNALSSSARSNVSNVSNFFKNYLGITLSKQQDSALRQLRKYGITIALIKGCNCKPKWNNIRKYVELEFDMENYINNISSSEILDDDSLF